MLFLSGIIWCRKIGCSLERQPAAQNEGGQSWGGKLGNTVLALVWQGTLKLYFGIFQCWGLNHQSFQLKVFAALYLRNLILVYQLCWHIFALQFDSSWNPCIWSFLHPSSCPLSLLTLFRLGSQGFAKAHPCCLQTEDINTPHRLPARVNTCDIT